MSSRAIHVEIVTSLSLNDFLLAFNRFNNFRGKIDIIYCDDKSTFQGVSKLLPELLRDPRLRNVLRAKDIKWSFIPPYARRSL